MDSQSIAISVRSLLDRYPTAIHGFAGFMAKCGDQEAESRLRSLADDIKADLAKNKDVFNPALVKIERIRQSVTQGSAKLFYDNELLCHFGDNIEMKKVEGQIVRDEHGGVIYEGASDSEWVEAAKRIFETGLMHLSLGGQIAPIRTRDDVALIAKLENIVTSVARFRRAEVAGDAGNPDELGSLQAAAILIGYASGHPFKAIKVDVENVVNQIYANRYFKASRDGLQFDYDEICADEQMLRNALNDGLTKNETKISGAEIKRGSIRDFYSAHGLDLGWLYIPTGQEPYTECCVNIESRVLATYSEGDYTVVDCKTDDVLREELVDAVKFYVQHAGAESMEDISQSLLDFAPELRQVIDEQAVASRAKKQRP